MRTKRFLHNMFLASLGFGCGMAAFSTAGAKASEALDDAGSGGGGGDTGDTGAGDGDANAGGDGASDDKAAKAKAKADEPVFKASDRDQMLRDMMALKNKLKQQEERLRTMPSPEEIEELRQEKAKKQQEEEERKKREGKFEELLVNQKQNYEKRMQELTLELEQERQSHRNEKINNALATEIPKHTTVEISDVATLLKPFVSIDPETNEFVITDRNGSRPINEKGKEMKLAEWVESEISKRPYFASAKPANGSGGSTQRGGKGAKQAFTDEEISKMSREELAKYKKDILATVGG